MEGVIAVISGDVISSTKIKEREHLIDVFHSMPNQVAHISKCKGSTLYRGDSYQIEIERAEEALRIAIILRLLLKTNTPEGENMNTSNGLWDMRVSIGVGTVSFRSEDVETSDGKAYQLSGRNLSKIGKQNLIITTPWQEVNDELEVSTAFADDIITNWTFSQSQVMLEMLFNEEIMQKQIAEKLNKSPQSISVLLKAAKSSNIIRYIERYESLILNRKQQ